MRICWTRWSVTLLLCGCAHARTPAPPAIPDAEPDVTLQVGALLAQLAQGALAPERLTGKAQAALAPSVPLMAAALRPCPRPPPLQLLARTTKGEDRNYLYRALCDNTSLLVEIDFNKAARINRLAIRPESD